MKKFVLTAIFAFATFFVANAQNDTVFFVTNMGSYVELCTNKYDRALIYADENCNEFSWLINYSEELFESPLIITPDMGYLGSDWCPIEYLGCGSHYNITLVFSTTNVPQPNTQLVWKRQGEPLLIEAVGVDSLEMFNFHWSTGETTSTINVTQPGIYTCGISDMCATATRTFIVRDNVELYRATVDLETNLNKTTWQVTEEQAEYISGVKVYRDGMLVGTALYQDGYFLDAIGSDNAARNYHLVGVTTEGEDCPIESYEKGTIHTTYYQDVNNNLNMTWNIPYVEEGAQGTLTYFQICKYDPNTGELTVVDQVNASITDYTCGVNQFDGGYAVIAAVFNDGKGLEELSFSNMTEDILSVGENAGNQIRIYPNPANGRFTVEGIGMMHISNVLGQEILAKEIDGKETVELPKGMYFVQLNGTVRKIVVE